MAYAEVEPEWPHQGQEGAGLGLQLLRIMTLDTAARSPLFFLSRDAGKSVGSHFSVAAKRASQPALWGVPRGKK